MDKKQSLKNCIFTVGHSNIGFDEFCRALKSFDVQKLIDVRSYPGSRYVPHFNKENIAGLLKENQIEYRHFPKLGGRRKSYCKDDYCFVDGWQNTSFKNYASYTLTGEYDEGIEELIEESKKSTVCIMCAESVPWRCHRLLISNTLINKGVDVYHIMDEEEYIKHQLNKFGAFAKSVDGKIIYPKI